MGILSKYDIKLFYSTKATAEVGTSADPETWTPAASYLGGARTLVELSNDYLHNFLNKTVPHQQITGITKFRCGYIFNNNLTDYIKNPILIVVADTSSPSDHVEVGWGTSKIGSGLTGALDGSIEQEIANEHVLPTNVHFFGSNVRNEGAILNADIPPQKGKAFWIKYNSLFNAQDYAYNNFRIRLLADNLYNDVLPASSGNPIPPIVDIPIVGEIGNDIDWQKLLQWIFGRFPDFMVTVGNNNSASNPRNFITSIKGYVKRLLMGFGNLDVINPTVKNSYYSTLAKYDFIPKTRKKYYGKTYGNIHILVMDTSGDEPYTKPSDQYTYVENDLKSAAGDPDVDWIVVVTNRAMYASQTPTATRFLFPDLRDTYHQLFTETQVCMVWQGTFRFYERTKVLGYNEAVPGNPVSFDYDYIPYPDPPTEPTPGVKYDTYTITDRKGFADGQIYMCIGTGGLSHDIITNPASYSIKRNFIDFGYGNLHFDNTGMIKKLTVTFFSTGRILQQNMDRFTIERTA